MRNWIKITESGASENFYYVMYIKIVGSNAKIRIGGLDGIFQLTQKQRKKVGKFLLEAKE